MVVVLLDAFIIDRIRRRETERGRRETERGRQRPALRLPVPPPPPLPERPCPDGRERGVVVIDFEIKYPG